ncbi:hypothetical protein PVAND_005914 [Polypedilum vanderplanki]|uniref:RING-CH-type domain-containing protein n=1 Tax=Polypedilum vanderplanki TaxID=319348 RepID=A0A9J6C1L4_POLVA|nr:hypothetical protein PVAND_005914 [Polypedilum vanderplanki]
MSTFSSLSLTQKSNNDNTFCRICYSFSSEDLIPMPCKCRSTIGHVHRRCLSRWIVAVRKNACEICHSVYDKNVVKVHSRNFKTMFCSFFFGPIPSLLRFSLCMMCFSYIGVFLCQKLSIIYEPFEEVMVDAGDIIERLSFLDAVIFVPSIFAYIHLAKMSFLNFQRFLSSLHNWWNQNESSNSNRFEIVL